MRAGILIVGSLYWDSRPERKAWRKDRLMMGGAVHVKVPIRYGRTSQTRNDTYTMTIDAPEASGTALILPCRPIGTLNDLATEACALWTAEQPGCTDPKRIASNGGEPWGCVGVRFREENNLTAHAEKLRTDWEKYWKGNGGAPIRPVDNCGRLGIDWPKTILETDAEFDVILATATRGTRKDNVTSQNIADSWIDGGYEYYFFNNVKHGIRTAEDVKIWTQIKKRAPCWVNYQKYSKAVEMLHALTEGCLAPVTKGGS